MKKSFVLHVDTLGILDELTDEQAGQLFKKIYEYHNIKKPKETQKTHSVNSVIDLLFFSFKMQFDRDLDKYESKVIRNTNNGKLGGRPKKINPLKAKKADSVNDSVSVSDNVSVSVNDNVKEKKERLPTKKVGLPKNEIVGKEKSLYSEFVAVWFDNWKDYVFTAKDGLKIKSLINKLKLFAKKNNVEPTDAELLKYWEIIIQKMPEFYKGKDLSVVDSKINEIVNEIKNKQHGNSSKYA